jgi:hypothetical protein
MNAGDSVTYQDAAFAKFINGERRQSVIINIGAAHENQPIFIVDSGGHFGGHSG